MQEEHYDSWKKEVKWQAFMTANGCGVYDIVGLKLHEGCQRKGCSEGQLESWVLAESRQHMRGLHLLSYLQHAQ